MITALTVLAILLILAMILIAACWCVNAWWVEMGSDEVPEDDESGYEPFAPTTLSTLSDITLGERLMDASTAVYEASIAKGMTPSLALETVVSTATKAIAGRMIDDQMKGVGDE